MLASWGNFLRVILHRKPYQFLHCDPTGDAPDMRGQFFLAPVDPETPPLWSRSLLGWMRYRAVRLVRRLFNRTPSKGSSLVWVLPVWDPSPTSLKLLWYSNFSVSAEHTHAV